jgi:hypothetical protein
MKPPDQGRGLEDSEEVALQQALVSSPEWRFDGRDQSPGTIT